jgi:transcriptional regulator with XRE-family HTH domain
VLKFALRYVIIKSDKNQATGGGKVTTGENIKRLREAKNMTQEELAQILGVTSSNISQIESGDRGLNIAKARKLAQALGVTIDELVRE